MPSDSTGTPSARMSEASAPCGPSRPSRLTTRQSKRSRGKRASSRASQVSAPPRPRPVRRQWRHRLHPFRRSAGAGRDGGESALGVGQVEALDQGLEAGEGAGAGLVEAVVEGGEAFPGP